MNRTNWQPLLTGESFERAQEAIAAIAESLRGGAVPDGREQWTPEMIRMNEASLAGGYAGQALYFGYLYQATGEDQAGDVALSILDRAIESASAARTAPTFYSGLPGVVWVANHLAGRLYPQDEENPYQEVDEALLAYVQQCRWPFQFDVISGLAGLGVYALEQLPHPVAQRCLEEIVDRLTEAAEESGGGISWRTPPLILPEHHLDNYPAGYFNLGMAHGVPCLVALLARLYAAGISPDKVGSLLEGSVSWLLERVLPPDSPSRYPTWWSEGHEPVHARLAWCYGDPGVAAALLHAGAALNRSDWLAEAVTTARKAASRAADDAAVKDTGLCHGKAGVAHIFNRLYQASGAEELRDAALFWFEKLLAARRPGRDYGGFQARLVSSDEVHWARDPGFLTGSAGIGLALLAATTDVQPDWDRVLLTDVSPRT